MSRFKMARSPEYLEAEMEFGTDVVKEIDAETGATSATWTHKSGMVLGALWTKGGRAQRFRFASVESAKTWVTSELAKLRADQQRKAAKRAERSAHVTKLVVGDVLVSSWGYEQTNVDYYQVTRVVSAQMVEIRPIASKIIEATGPMSETVTADPGNFRGEPKRHRVTVNDSIKLTSYSWAYKWDGKPDHASHYA